MLNVNGEGKKTEKKRKKKNNVWWGKKKKQKKNKKHLIEITQEYSRFYKYKNVQIFF